MKIWMMSLILTMTTSIALARGGVTDLGNGGAGVLVNGRPVVLDLYEMGLEEGAIDQSIKPDADMIAAVLGLDLLNSSEKGLLAIKLTEVSRLNARVGTLLAMGLSRYIWQVVQADLNVIPEKTPLDVETVQLANRLGSVVRIQKGLWDKMSSSNKVALLIHEVVYAYAPLRIAGESLYRQDSIPVRELVGLLFSPDLRKQTRLAQDLMEGMFSYLNARAAFTTGDLLVTITYYATKGLPTTNNLTDFCSKVRERTTTKLPFTGSLNIRGNVEVIALSDYKTLAGVQKRLIFWEAEYLDKNLNFNFTSENAAACEAWLEAAIMARYRKMYN
ncbi:hypothetical protein [Bdellovibrio sp. HCB2-146]|uniref:hypothetical protein n=1 Tax=Bdellovibrio sp. HCB2-146 TaxID=3394362 RepID=UPI0039BC7257